MDKRSNTDLLLLVKDLSLDEMQRLVPILQRQVTKMAAKKQKRARQGYTERFVTEMCVLDADAEASVAELFEAWERWNNNRPIIKSIFIRYLMGDFGVLRSAQRGPNGARYRAVRGIRLKSGCGEVPTDSDVEEANVP